jgi:CHASE2 domain-containing sensor protein
LNSGMGRLRSHQILRISAHYGRQSAILWTVFFALPYVACITLWQDRRKEGLLLVAGVLAGAHDVFVSLLCALVAWLWVQYRRRSAALSSMLSLAGGRIMERKSEGHAD